MTEAGVQVFRGIRFAEPAGGPNRWRPPAYVGDAEPTGAWAPDCPQAASNARSRAAEQSEDCLFLNVWTPTTDPDARLPVLVWFYGGSFLFGSASDADTDGSALAARGVVVVAPNYRVGIFGYLAHPAFSAESLHGSSGNYGLLDNLAALRWVRENIDRYGGDPGRVSAAGVSAGSASLALLQTSPLARPEAGPTPFDRLILHSPGSFRPLAPLVAAEEEAAEAYGDDPDRMRAWSADEALTQSAALVPKVRGLTTSRLLRPIRDGWVITEDDRVAYGAARILPVPTMVGSAIDEGGSLTAGWPIATPDDFDGLLVRDFGPSAGDARPFYAPLDDSEESVRAASARLFGDTQFAFGARGIARAVAGAGAGAWRFRVDGADGRSGHGAEIDEIFACSGLIGSTLAEAWIRFAAGEAPLEADRWPAYDEAEAVLVLGADVALGHGEGDDRLDFLERFYQGRDD